MKNKKLSSIVALAIFSVLSLGITNYVSADEGKTLDLRSKDKEVKEVGVKNFDRENFSTTSDALSNEDATTTLENEHKARLEKDKATLIKKISANKKKATKLSEEVKNKISESALALVNSYKDSADRIDAVIAKIAEKLVSLPIDNENVSASNDHITKAKDFLTQGRDDITLLETANQEALNSGTYKASLNIVKFQSDKVRDTLKQAHLETVGALNSLKTYFNIATSTAENSQDENATSTNQ